MRASVFACRVPDLLATLASRLADADVDGAIDAGLMSFAPCAGDCCGDAASVLAAQQRLRYAWAARDRHRARALRLKQRAAERDARRRPASTDVQRPSLPPAATAILARAKAKAANRSGGHDPA